MYLSLLLFQILEERSLHGEFNLASKSKSKLSFPFLSKPKVLAPITPAFDLAAWRAGTAWSFPAFSDLFKTLYLSGSVSFKVRGTSFVRGFELHQLRRESRGEGAAFFLVPLGISVDISFLRASLYPNNIPRVLPVLLCRAGLGFDIAGGISLRDISVFFQNPCWPMELFLEVCSSPALDPAAGC